MIREFDVVIAGGGLVGAAFAALLAGDDRQPGSQPLRIAVVDPQPFGGYYGDDEFDPRVVALTEQSRQLLEQVGVWRSIAERRVSPYRSMSVRDSDGTGHVAFDCSEVRAANLGHIVENSAIVGALHERLAQLPSVELICPARVAEVEHCDDGNGERVQVTLDSGEQLSASLLAAADGGLSKVRELCDFNWRQVPYGHHAIVATIRCEQANGGCARQWFSSDGPLAFLPLRNGDDDHHVSIVWSQREAQAEQLMALDDEAFCEALTRASESELGAVESISKRFSFPLRESHASDYVQPGIALLGDAAHTIHPLAGQGVNLGFKDVVALAEELQRARQRDLPLGDMSVLGRYQRARKADNQATIWAMKGFKELFASDNLMVRLLRNTGMSLVNETEPVKKRLIRQAMGL